MSRAGASFRLVCRQPYPFLQLQQSFNTYSSSSLDRKQNLEPLKTSAVCLGDVARVSPERGVPCLRSQSSSAGHRGQTSHFKAVINVSLLC